MRARSNENKLLIFVNQLVKTCQHNNVPAKVAPTKAIDYICVLKIKIISPAEIKALIKKLNPRKISGCDLINIRILQKFLRKTLLMITYIVNGVFCLNYAPSAFRSQK